MTCYSQDYREARTRLLTAAEAAGGWTHEALAHPQVAATGLAEPMDYPTAMKSAPVVRAPITLSRSAKAPLAAAPQAGEHSDAILSAIGYDAEAIAALRAKKII